MQLSTLIAAVALVTTVSLAPIAVQTITGLIIPILTGFITKSGASAGIKQAVTVILAGVSGVVTSSIVEGGFAVFTLETFLYAATSWVIAIAMYNGVYVTHDLNEHTAPNRGLGALDTTGVEKTQ